MIRRYGQNVAANPNEPRFGADAAAPLQGADSGRPSRSEQRRVPSDDTLLRDLGWITLKQRRLISKLNLFYKIINRHIPDYLYEDCSLIQLAFDRKTTRFTLNVEIRVPFCRTNKYKLSYFPSTIVAWNSLSLSRNLDSLSKFKAYLNSKYYPPENFFNYNLFSGACSRIFTQARLGLCSLNFDLFRYTLTDNPLCPNCNSLESLCHYLLVCPSIQRGSCDSYE